MSTRTHNHVDERGSLPVVSITNWGKYIALAVKAGDHEMTSFIYPDDDETTEEFIARIRAQFIDLTVEVNDPAKYQN
jgi:hypothetical protein